jgi:hypothetical protein
LLARGAAALSDAELLALLLRTGIKGKGVLQMADELLQLKSDSSLAGRNEGFDGISGLLHATADDLKRVKGLGPAKRAELVAVLELARRAMSQQLRERPIFSEPEVIKHYLKLNLAVRGHEVFAVLFLDAQNRMLAMEEMFRGTLSQLSVTLLRKYFGWFRHFTATPSGACQNLSPNHFLKVDIRTPDQTRGQCQRTGFSIAEADAKSTWLFSHRTHLAKPTFCSRV